MTTAVAFAACRIVRHFFVTDQAFHCDVDSPFFLSREIACVDAPRRSYLLFPDVDRAELMTSSGKWDSSAVRFRTTDSDRFYAFGSDSRRPYG